jgi:hypothetical protein
VDYHILLEKEQSALRKNNISSLKHGRETGRRILGLGNYSRIDFVLCSSCFWCASYFNCSGGVTNCPTCNSDNIESLPISNGEFYTFSHDRNRGVTLGFSEKRRYPELI